MKCCVCLCEMEASFMFVVAHAPACAHIACDLCLYKYGHSLFLATVEYYADKSKGRPARRACPVQGCGVSWELFLLNSIHVPLVENGCGTAWDSYIHKCIPDELTELPICNYVKEEESWSMLRKTSPRALLRAVKQSWYH